MTSLLTPKNIARALRNQVPRKAFRDLRNRLTFGADAPLSDETIWVPIDRVTHAYTPGKSGRRFRRRHSGKVLGGDWHLARTPLSPSEKDISCQMHYVDGVPWEETPIWARHMSELASGHHPDGCRNVDELRAWYAQRDRVFAEIKKAGVLSPMALLPDRTRREQGGIFVHVAPDGLFLRSGGGAHRFAIARILGTPYIPAQVGVVHRDALSSGIYASLHRGVTPPALLTSA